MRILVTGAMGKVGRAAVAALDAAGHDVTASDRLPKTFDAPASDAPPHLRVPYVEADLTDFGQVSSLIGGASGDLRSGSAIRFDAIVHAGAIPAAGQHAPHVVFGNNLGSLFGVVEACVRWGVPRLVNISSETVPGFIFAERPFYPAYLPLDEAHPVTPQDPYALAKHLGEQVCDAAVRRSDLRVISIRPTWVQDAASWERNLGAIVRDEAAPGITGWAYIDADDLGEAIRLAAECDVPGHEVVYIAAVDTIGGRDLHAAWKAAFPDAPTELRPVARPDASGIDCRKAHRLLGWQPARTWRDHLTPAGTAHPTRPPG